MAMSWQADKVNTSTAYLMHAAFLPLPDNPVRLLLLPLALFPTLCSPRTAFALNMFRHEYCWRVFSGFVSNTIHFVPGSGKSGLFWCERCGATATTPSPLISRNRQTRAHTHTRTGPLDINAFTVIRVWEKSLCARFSENLRLHFAFGSRTHVFPRRVDAHIQQPNAEIWKLGNVFLFGESSFESLIAERTWAAKTRRTRHDCAGGHTRVRARTQSGKWYRVKAFTWKCR